MHSEKVFKVNEYITLKLEGEDTNIYIKGRYFRQCKYLLINIPITQISSFEDIKSIDEAAENLDHTLDPHIDEEGNIYRIDRIPPEVEFWGHCSNLQVWYENDYDTRLLHRNLAFPLLIKLTEEGDPLAKKVFNNEVIKRIEIGNKNVIKFLILERYIDHLEFEELEVLMDYQPFIDSFNSLLEEEFLTVYMKALDKHGMKFQFFRKNEKAFPVDFILQRLRKKAPDLLKKLLEKIIINTSYNSMLYLHIENYFNVLDYQNFSEAINSHIIKELQRGLGHNSPIIFNFSFLMLVSLSYGIHGDRHAVRRIRLKDNLHLKNNLEPEQCATLINNIAKRLVLYYDIEEYRFHHDLICDFLSSFGEYAIEGLTYIFDKASGELQSIAEKCLVQIKTKNPNIEIGILPKIDVNINTILKLNSKEIKTLIPFHTGKTLVEKVLLKFYTIPQSDDKGDYFELISNFFKEIGNKGEILLGSGVMSVLKRRNLEVTELLIDLKILEYLTVEEALLIVQNLDFVRDFLIVLEKQEHYEAKSGIMGRLSKFFEKLRDHINKSLENRIINIFEEFPSTFQIDVVKLSFIAIPTLENLIQLFHHRITDSDIFDHWIIDPFFKNLASHKDIVEELLLSIIKNQDRKILEGILNSGFLYNINRKDLITLNVEIFENFIPMAKRVFELIDNPESLSAYSYDYEWDYHDEIKYLEKLFDEIKETRSSPSLPKE